MKKILIAIMTALLLITSGCAQTDEQKVQKVAQKAAKLIADSNGYQGAIDLFKQSLEKGLPTELVKPLIEETYVSWSVAAMTEAGGDVTKALDVIDAMIEEYPDSQEKGEQVILDYGKLMIENCGEDVSAMSKVWEGFIARYYMSDKICYEIDHIFKSHVTALTDRQFDVIKDSLLAALERDDWQAAFRRITEFRQQTYATLLGRGGIFPYTRKMNNGKTVIVEYVHTFFTLYYGEVDSDNKRNGEGRQMTYAVNYEKAPEQYIEEYLHGNFINDMVNGEFEEVNHVNISTDSVAHISGMMIDNKYDGEIISVYENNGKTREYTFTFNDGIVKSLGRLVNFEGDYYAVGVTNEEPPFYYGYQKENLKTERGFYPYYGKLH
ncbi:MAG: hypothetical protein E7186_05800 [Erysipelotrichaceae bacterium]|nr:hypothetical protein [Erysipelotrichaceae bacterium]